MNHEQAKEHQKELDRINQAHSDKLQEFNVHRNSMGLVPDHIRETPEYKKANEDFKKSFAELRKFNQWYVKTFMKKSKKSRSV